MKIKTTLQTADLVEALTYVAAHNAQPGQFDTQEDYAAYLKDLDRVKTIAEVTAMARCRGGWVRDDWLEAIEALVDPNTHALQFPGDGTNDVTIDTEGFCAEFGSICLQEPLGPFIHELFGEVWNS
jgi:hypothetical protein